jgi:hypothetical protein
MTPKPPVPMATSVNRLMMLGTGRGPQRQAQMRERFAPLVGQLVARTKAQGRLRSDILTPDLPLIQLMLGAVTEHFAEPELWRHYLALILDGMRDRPDLLPLPQVRTSQGKFGRHLG